ncbi:MAG: hypothetical protein RBT81_13080 [Gammaproteobacteria bacterium]|jgi:predicted dehydrogenase|nr:hypothetical protein [Gammaproteobacteria bacterium]
MSAALRLGVIGLSPGNGHPYSWSAIFNGYDAAAMEHCGFPVIPRYLEKQRFPDDAIAGARVTHVWTQNSALSRHIAQATLIDHVVEYPADMIGQVDAVLLARDDAENHRRFAEPFIAAGLPIYIDKPLAHSRQAAIDFFALETRPAQIFSCSALRFAEEMLLSPREVDRMGGISHISARVPKSWSKYAIHVVDPILRNCGPFDNIRNVRARSFGPDGSGTEVSFEWSDEERTCEIRAFGSEPSPISVAYSGPKGAVDTQFKDSFSAFKSALETFLKDSVRGQVSHAVDVIEAMKVLELGAGVFSLQEND